MDQIQATLQLTLAAGGRVLVVSGKNRPRLGAVQPENIRVVTSASDAIFNIQRTSYDVVICPYPAFNRLAQLLSAQGSVSVMMTVSRKESRQEAVAFARTLRNCAILPADFSLEALLQRGAVHNTEGLSTHYLRRLPRLTALWAKRKTGVVQFIQRDGAWDSIALRRGGLVQTGNLSIIQKALQMGKLRFTERAVSGDPSREAMGRLLLQLAGMKPDPRFAAMHRDWTIRGLNPEDIPVSAATRQLLLEADGESTLRMLLARLGLREQAISEELHALTRLRLVRLQPPESYALQPLHDRIQSRLTLDHALHDATRRGLAGEPAPMTRKIARWQAERYDRLREDPALSPPLQDEAEEISGLWRKVFVDGRSVVED